MVVSVALVVLCAACSGGTQKASTAPTAATTTTTLTARSNAAPTATTVFRSGEDGYNTFRIPAIVAAKDDSLLAFAEGRVASAADDGQVNLVLKRSTDGGHTWGPLQVVAKDGVNFVGNPAVVVDQKSGRVVVLATHKDGGDNEVEIDTATGVDSSRIWLVTSADNGRTWGEPKDLTSVVKPAGWRWYTVGPGHAIQLRQGAHAGRLVAAANHTDGTKGTGDHVLLSDDGGLTWRVGADDTPGPGPAAPDESAVAELPNGTLVFSSRNQQDAPWHRLQATSTDAGQSFATPYAQQAGLIVPVVEGSLLWAGGPSGRLFFAAPGSATDRVDLTLHASTDSGQTWSAGTRIVTGPSAYSDLIELSGGRIGVLYETGVKGPNERIDFTSIGMARVR